MSFKPDRFYAKVSQIPSDQPNCWAYQLVEIFDLDFEGGPKKVGEYTRNYSNHGKETFKPFYLHNRWWALYSKDYEELRVMTLPECEDYCGFQNTGGKSSEGFCPVELYLPFYLPYTLLMGDAKLNSRYWDEAALEKLDSINTSLEDSDTKYKYGELTFESFGFILGCYWGGLYNIGFLDLSKLPEKKAIMDFRFGEIEATEDMTLKQIIKLDKHTDSESPIVEIILTRMFDIQTGEDITF